MVNRLFPGLLVAAPSVKDPEFKNSVIVIGAHEPDGAIGYNISRTASVSFHELLSNLSIAPRIADQAVLFGGPVSKYSGFIVYRHRFNQPRAPGMALSTTLSITPARQVLEEAALGKIKTFDLILGYAGWGPYQLEREIAKGQWFHTPFYPEVITDIPVNERWCYVYERLGFSPYHYVSVRGGAKA